MYWVIVDEITVLPIFKKLKTSERVAHTWRFHTFTVRAYIEYKYIDLKTHFLITSTPLFDAERFGDACEKDHGD